MAAPRRRRLLGGLLVRRECWRLSLTGKLLMLMVVAGLLLLIRTGLYPFLAENNPTARGVLVVEAWIPAYGIEEAAVCFKKEGYQKIVTSGSVTDNQWSDEFPGNYVDAAAVRLGKLGIAGEFVQAVPCRGPLKDRTYGSALAVKQWLQENQIPVKSIDIVTEAVHARRSRLLFQMAFGPEVEVGVIGVEDRDFEPAHWWRSSKGVREVLDEAIAYVYAKFIFSPP